MANGYMMARKYLRLARLACGQMPPSNQWPLYCIDWEYAARELKHDYTSVDFDGVTYWVR